MTTMLRPYGRLTAPEPGEGRASQEGRPSQRAIIVGPRPARPHPGGRARLLVAVAAEAAILAALLLVHTTAPVQHPVEAAVTLVTVPLPASTPLPPKPASPPAPLPLLAAPAPPPPTATAAIAPPADLPLAVAADISPPRHLPARPHARMPQHPAPASPSTAPATAAAAPSSTRAAGESLPSSAAPAAPSRAAMDSFEGRLRAAVQAALRYPAAARMLGVTGHARVGFRWRDGATSELQLVSSAGMAVLDQEALEAVRSAAYPPAPQSLAHQTLNLIVHVDFDPPSDDN